MPETANLSIYSGLHREWDVMADLQYTGWSSIQIPGRARHRCRGVGGLHWNFRNTWRVAAGVNYTTTNECLFRGGVAYDQTPTNNTDRTPGLPDNNRTWLASGVHYHFTAHWQVRPRVCA